MKKGTNIKWTLEKIKEGFEAFYKENGRYPTTPEVDRYAKLPSARQIQRSFGGLPAIRKQLNLAGPHDFTKGEYSTQRANMISQRAHKVEKEVYIYLSKIFGSPFVHREFFFNDDRRTRTDFYVYCAAGERFSVDVFYPNSLINLNNCLNSKLKTYKGLTLDYPIIFLMMNDSIPENMIESMLGNKKSKLAKNQSVMTFRQFQNFCNTKGRASILE